MLAGCKGVREGTRLPLHLVADVGGTVLAVGEAELVEVVNGLETGVLGKGLVGSVCRKQVGV
jgi:hypothetical protein